MTDKTLAQIQSEWITHGNIAKMQAKLDREPDEGKRRALQDVIDEQRKLILP